MEWHPGSWRSRPAAQMPLYADAEALLAAERALSQAAPVAPIEESEALKRRLAEASAGGAFLLQGGDCAEVFAEPASKDIEALAALFDEMAAPLAAAMQVPIIRLGRIAGQAAKPRGAPTELRDGTTLPIYRGDLINSGNFDPSARRANPSRLLRGHAHARSVKAQLDRLPEPLFTSHEALLLPYEEALVRRDAAGGRHWSVSGHFLWVGDRTRQLDGAHVEFVRGLANPIGVKCGPGLTADALLRLCDLLDPQHEPGRLTLIVRLGADRIVDQLPGWMQALRRADRRPLWVSDPMHGNTERSGALKIRRYETMLSEARRFFTICTREGVWPGGLHLEMSPALVTECLGGRGPAGTGELIDWRSACDPRLNRHQAIDFAGDVSRFAAKAAAA